MYQLCLQQAAEGGIARALQTTALTSDECTLNPITLLTNPLCIT